MKASNPLASWPWRCCSLVVGIQACIWPVLCDACIDRIVALRQDSNVDRDWD